jgi:hypothetical protein
VEIRHNVTYGKK